MDYQEMPILVASLKCLLGSGHTLNVYLTHPKMLIKFGRHFDSIPLSEQGIQSPPSTTGV